MPFSKPGNVESLSRWLFKFYDKPKDELGIVARRWGNLSEETHAKSYKEILAAARSLIYDNAKNRDFAVESAHHGVSQENYPPYEERWLASLDKPPVVPLDKRWVVGKYTGRILPRDDPRGLYLGEHTDSCQHPDGEGATAAWYGQESPNAGFFVVENPEGEIVAESLVWESDDGGLVFDSIEGKKLGTREKAVAEVYELATKELSQKYHTINVGSDVNAGRLAVDLSRWKSAEGSDFLALPADMSGYTDARKQVTITTNPDIPRRAKPVRRIWVRGASEDDIATAEKIARRVYSDNWSHVPEGDWYRILETRGQGPIGYAVMDITRKQVNDVAVLPEYKGKSLVLLREMLKKMRSVGGDWTASARESTSYKLLKYADQLGWIELKSEILHPGMMDGENMYDVMFSPMPRHDNEATEP